MKSQLAEQLQRLGLNPTKAAMLAVLGLVLLGTIVFQFLRFSGPEVASKKIASRPKPPIKINEPAARAASSRTPAVTPARPGPSTSQDRARLESELPIDLSRDLPEPPALGVPIAQILRLDPFTPPITIPSADDSLNVRDEESDNSEQDTGDARERRSSHPPEVPVQRIVIGPMGSAALINGVWYAEGDRWSGLRIHSIRIDGVILETD